MLSYDIIGEQIHGREIYMHTENFLIRFFRMTLSPILRRVFGRRRLLSTLCLFAALLISATLLSGLCFAFTANLNTLDALQVSYDEFINTGGLTTSAEGFRAAVREVLSAAKLEILITHVLLLLLWLIPSVAAVSRVLNEAVESEKYVYALYIVYGADPQKLRRQLYTEFLTLGLPALLLGMIAARWICASVMEAGAPTLTSFLEVLLLFGSLTVISARRVTGRLFKKTCIKLLDASDTSEYIHSPRRSRIPKRPHRCGGRYYASLAFRRMGKYHLVRALSVGLVAAVLFVLSGITLPDTYAKSDVTLEYAMTFPNGISYDTLNDEHISALSPLTAIAYTETNGSDTADRLGTHLLMNTEQIGDGTEEAYYTGDRWAFDELKIACADGNVEAELGGEVDITGLVPSHWLIERTYALDSLQPGQAIYVYPQGEEHYTLGSHVELSLPSEDGFSPEGDMLTVEIVSTEEIGWIVAYENPRLPPVKVAPRITEDYLFLSAADYGRLTGTVKHSPVDVTETFPMELDLEVGSCYLLLPEALSATYAALSTLTTVTPTEPIIQPFEKKSLNEDKKTLPTDEYYINRTIERTGIYLGDAATFTRDTQAMQAMGGRFIGGDWTGSLDSLPDMKITEYTVAGHRTCEGISQPYVVFVHDENTIFTTYWQTDLSAVSLSDSGIEDSHLYYTVSDFPVLTLDEGDCQVGDTLFLGTEVPADFCTAMEQAGIPLGRTSTRSYEFTKGRIQTIFSSPSGKRFLVYAADASSDLALDKYPAVITGKNSYVPVGDTSVNSIASLKDSGSMLLIRESRAGAPTQDAIRVDGHWADNNFTLAPNFVHREVGTVADGEAVLLMPDQASYRISEGDSLRLAISQDLQAGGVIDPSLAGLEGLSLLEQQMSRLTYRYVTLRVSSVRRDAEITEPVLILSEDTFSTVCNRTGTVTRMDIYVNANASISALSKIYSVLNEVSANGDASLDFHGRILRSRATGTQHYLSLLRIMILPLAALLPILMLSSRRSLELRRREERQAYLAAGGNRGLQLSMCLWEGLWLCLCNVAVSAVACPLIALIMAIIGGKLHAPFTLNSFSTADLASILILTAVCSVLTSCLSLFDMPPQYRRRRTRTTKYPKGGSSA